MAVETDKACANKEVTRAAAMAGAKTGQKASKTDHAGANDSSVRFMYGTRFGRIVLHTALFLRIPALLGALLRTPLSRLYIPSFIRKNGIDMTGFEGVVFHSFNDFFTRKKAVSFDAAPDALIAPADSLLSVYQITDEARFHIKGFDYTLQDFFEPERFGLTAAETAARFSGGTCLVFRLCATDYHRYCYIDDGRHSGIPGENHFIPGTLYSVQPLAAEKFRIYTKNRRSWTIMHTEHFGDVAQIEVGAFSVGGIVNHKPAGTETAFRKGEEKGYFDLHGSTIVLLLQKDAAVLNADVSAVCADGSEYRVRIGEKIGVSR
ncbi:MAG: phosphatidylserine decarboxylase [Treponema sp.]|nr:phosphatidylserine decarboxylase [Treponema sp.]